MKIPKYKIGDVVLVNCDNKIRQGNIFSAETVGDDWFYGIKIIIPPETIELVYSYEEDTGDAKSKIVKP